MTLFGMGREFGRLKEKVAQLEKSVGHHGLTESEVALMISNGAREMEEALHALELSLGIDQDKSEKVLHERINAFGASLGAVKEMNGQSTEAIRGIRRDWEALSGELRQLLRAEGATAADLAGVKERIHGIEMRISDTVSKMSALEHTLSDIRLRSDRK